jgi:hypothetical protein
LVNIPQALMHQSRSIGFRFIAKAPVPLEMALAF